MRFKPRVITIFSLLLFSFFHSGCKKEFFNWNLVAAPSISELTVNDNNLNNFVVSANCISDGNDEKTINGFCWSTSELPTTQDSIVKVSSGIGSFQAKINWSLNSTIYIRAFTQNGVTTQYSQQKKIIWIGTSNLQPSISTLTSTVSGFTSVEVMGEIINTSGLEIQEVGFCISTNSTPTIKNSTIITLTQNNSTSYKSSISNLIDGTTYYVSFYTKSIVGYTYGNIISMSLPKKYTIGEKGPGNGIIFYQNPAFSNEWNFLEVYPGGIGGVCTWGPNSNKTNSTDINLGSGFKNSNDINSFFGVNSIEYAAHKVKITINNKSDWYLPSLLELKLAFSQLKVSQSFGNINIGSVYWSSSEDSNFPNNAWAIKVNNNDFQSNTIDKTTLNAVQPIRRF